jgi:gliding motility-associated lipoprotein GldD
MNKLVFIFISLFILNGCKEETLPKPPAYLRLDFEDNGYVKHESNCYHFEKNNASNIKKEKDCNLELHYPKQKATIYLTYRPVVNNINILLSDAQKLTYEHVIKADEIEERPYINKNRKVYGMFYNVTGNAATNTQFYITDSTKHFMVGSLYFYAKPNYDSIFPAIEFIKKDMVKIMESTQWQ